jgi:iron complex outermembrane receptor protein
MIRYVPLTRFDPSRLPAWLVPRCVPSTAAQDCLALLFGVIACAAPVHADGLAGNLADAANAPGLEEIIVSADRRNVDLERAPVAITAVSAEELDASNVTQLADLNGLVPGLTIAKSSGFERIVTIRGIGSETPENAYTTQPGVSFHIDGVYVGNSISLDESLFDVDHIEVSRGPQATVFGQTSTGGTINLISRQPALEHFDAYVEASGGTYDLWRSRGMVNIPLGDDWALRASVQGYSHEGFATDTNLPGFRLDAAHDWTAKSALLWQPTAAFSATLTAQLYSANHNGDEQKNILDPNADPRTVSQDYPSLYALANQLYYLNLVWNLPGAVLKSTSSWQVLDNHIQEDGTRLNVAQLGFYDHVQPWDTWMRDLTQEVSLASTPGRDWDWVLGGLYLAQINHQYVYETSNLVPAPYLLYDNDGHIDRHSYALYAQVTAHLSPVWRLTLGARYNHDTYGGPSSSYGVTTDDRYSKGVPTGKAEIEHDLAATTLSYLSFTRGYKPGGVNDNPQAVLVPHLFQSEAINAYELGVKYHSPDRRVLLNTAAYYYDYQDMQYIAVDPVPFQYGINNIPTSHIEGLELEGAWLALDDRLRVEGNFSAAHGWLVGRFQTLDAKAASDLIASTPACAFGGAYYNPRCWSQLAADAPNTDGNEVPKLPHWQGSVNLSYTANLGRSRLMSQIEYIYRGGFEYRIFNDGTLDHVPGYEQWNAYLELTPPGEHWHFALGVSNVFNLAGINARYTDPYGTGQTSDEFIPPRQVIGTVSYRL